MNERRYFIDWKERFPHLSQPPIVEAVLDARVVHKNRWDEKELCERLRNLLPDYSKIESLRESRFKVSKEEPGEFIPEDLGCVGLKLHCSEKPYIVQFNKGAFIFSRLTPYEDWQRFIEEGLRLLKVYSELLDIDVVKRIGLRFINRILVDQNTVELKNYYKTPPKSVEDLKWPLGGFFHRDVVQVPNTSYAVNLIKTVQGPKKTKSGTTGLILDIDVFTRAEFLFNMKELNHFLKEMRWVKNKIFFCSITQKAIEEFK